MVVRRSDTRTLKDFNKPTESLEQIAKDGAKGVPSKEGVLMSKKQIESARPSRHVLSEKPELRHYQQRFLPLNFLVLSAKGCLELRLVSAAILERTDNNTSRI